jgi:thiamine biosynthesis lipoprotein
VTGDGRLAQSWPVWGMVATVVVTEPTALAEATALLRAELAAVDAAASRFRPDSELSLINDRAGDWVPVSELTVTLLSAALDAARATDGAVDPTVGSALRAIGYDRDLALVAAGQTGPRITVRYTGPRWREVELDVARRRVRLPAGVELDLGATAKACAADRAAASASARLGAPVLVNLGGDLAVAGCHGDRPFTVVLAEDHRDTDGPHVLVGDGGIATSTTKVRRWVHSGQNWHHLLDPDTGRPTEGPWRTVTAAAATCLAANTATTATIVKGVGGWHWLAATGLPARLVGTDGQLHTVNDWPAETRDACFLC